MEDGNKKFNSIEKAMEILLAFAPYNQEMGTVEISKKLGFHKATVSRILLILIKYGFLQQNPRTKKFMLGPSITSLGWALNHFFNTNLVPIAKPYIDELRSTLKETIVLEALAGNSTVMAYIAEGPQRVRIAGTIGDRIPIHAAAGAKAILAFSPPEVRESFIVNGAMPRYTPNTITDPKVFQRQLQEIRQQGFSFDNEEIDIGINAVGVPIFNFEEKAVAAVVVAGPSPRVTWDSDSPIVARLKDTAAKISAQLHYNGEQNQ
jgi:IclR family KDG regulon transcriptional repressor